MTATTTRRVHIIGTHEPRWYASRPATCRCCDAPIPNTESMCEPCRKRTVQCQTCKGAGQHTWIIAGAPETELCSHCMGTGRVRKEAA